MDSVKAYDLIELAGRNLREAVLRNSLTTLGISVGVASLVAMLSLGVGLQEMANKRLAKSGLFDTIVVTSRRDMRNFNRAAAREGPPPAESRALDENARLEIEKITDVLEATPDIRFITEFRYQGKPHLTMVAGLPQSAKERDAFDSMQGTFFTSTTSNEAILQKEFADELLGVHDSPSQPNPVTPAQLQSMIGKELTLRYAERTTMPEPAGAEGTPSAKENINRRPASASRNPESNSGAANPPLAARIAGYSVVPHEATLRIVGITDQDPESMRGQGRARVFIPLQFAESLHIMLPTDLRENTGSLSTAQKLLLTQRAREKRQPRTDGSGFHQEDGIQHIFDSGRHTRLAALLRRPRRVSWNLRQPGFGCFFHRYCQHPGDGHSRAAS